MAKYIDREAVVAEFHRSGLGENSLVEKIFADGVYAVLETFPTADVEPVRHGRWIPMGYDGYADGAPVWDEWECSECAHEHSGDEDTLTAFCPNCGAKMDG